MTTWASAESANSTIWKDAESSRYLSLPGTTGNYASTPDSDALDITGDIEIIAYVAASDWMPTATYDICAKAVFASNQFSYRFSIVLNNGVLRIQVSPDGTVASVVTALSTVAPTISNGSGLWVRVTMDVDNDSSGNTSKFYTSTDDKSVNVSRISWTQLGNTVTNSGTTSIFNSSAALEVGANSVGTAQIFSGQIYGVYVYDGIGGTLAASFNADNAVEGAMSFTSWATGEVWTLNGQASIASA